MSLIILLLHVGISISVCWVVLVAQSCQLFGTRWTVACQAPLSMGFSRQEHWSGLPFPSPGDLPDPGIKPRSLALQADSLLSEPSSSRHISNVTSSMESFLCVRYPFVNFKISLLRGGAPYILTCIMDIQSE